MFVPISIPVKKIKNMKNLLFKFKLIDKDDEFLDGKKVWDIFRNNDFNYVEHRLFSKIFSNFVVSLFNYRIEGKGIKEILKDEMFGEFYYAEDYSKYYSYDCGLNVEKFLKLKSSREYDFI
ncbi:hypothetical protein SU69_01830 [Thermosipho melanesiensis]|uniref:hypothetical protein n=1 Tax=Thermosipho melanesiensis TaxID=46541 RepID=UPI0000ED2154|nr:hypothetical protein [Thermosipho melanesiensis]OOC37354.1 hypothetical protein SU68_01840 [Thermosipho melanesiensis]OOC39716.1 hypothetical protein SU69_01830 [Thermosipho melanesiensis]OOC39821.1 hypothetical protein SU70_01825 [Thermosipho melanesiensis]OOC43749.1 hypothetical protein SU71_01815 [Thermosipho melanesiensis]OOC45068.1 hypothetical protein SU72_01820 [Thermosipho melanesiensis]